MLSLEFGYSFKQALDKVKCPALLQQIVLGDMFDHSLQDVAWLCQLKYIILMFQSGCYSHSLGELSLPASLERLTIRVGVNVEGLELPSHATLILVK